MLVNVDVLRELTRSTVDARIVETYLFEPESLYYLLKAHAEKLGVSVSRIARTAGISDNMVSMWRRGINAPNVASLKRLSIAIEKLRKEALQIYEGSNAL
jgi:DNA-binding transcriptional regulator YiaG